MSIDAILSTSDRRGKKYKVVVMEGKRKKTIHFGADGMSDINESISDIEKKFDINIKHQ